jgi:cysteine synthase
MASALPLLRETYVSPRTILSQIGNTPLVFLPKLGEPTPGVRIFAKDESRNPGGSVKDRPALNMIMEGIRQGRLQKGPELVVEIAFNDVQQSSQYPGGMALRFARVKGYRPDKRAEEADTIDTVRQIFEAQS